MAAGDITILLERWAQGDPEAIERLTPLVYSHLRRIAIGYLRRERCSHTLEARAMRRILVNYARERQAAKRDAGDSGLKLSPALAWIDPEGPQIIDLDRALNEMEAMEPRKARVVELRIFLGCTSAEAADLIGISKPTIDRDLRFALAWLFDRLHSSA